MAAVQRVRLTSPPNSSFPGARPNERCGPAFRRRVRWSLRARVRRQRSDHGGAAHEVRLAAVAGGHRTRLDPVHHGHGDHAHLRPPESCGHARISRREAHRAAHGGDLHLRADPRSDRGGLHAQGNGAGGPVCGNTRRRTGHFARRDGTPGILAGTDRDLLSHVRRVRHRCRSETHPKSAVSRSVSPWAPTSLRLAR